jgi:dTDP-4-dehydrorhamnose reductase
MKNILVTGAKGQLGSEIEILVPKFEGFNFFLTDIDNLDITDYQSLNSYIENNDIQFIINCAAYTNVDKAESDIEKAYSINAEAVKNISDISLKNEIPVIHISTDYVFDGSSKIPYKEDDITQSLTVYGQSKLKGEIYAAHSFKYMIIRTSWLYSIFGHNFVKTILRLCNEKDEIKVVDDQMGSPTNAEDLAQLILHLTQLYFHTPEKFFSGIFHFSNEGYCSWYEFAKEIIQVSNLKCKVIPVTSNEFLTVAKRPAYSLLDKSKIKSFHKIEIEDWKAALKKCIKQLIS